MWGMLAPMAVSIFQHIKGSPRQLCLEDERPLSGRLQRRQEDVLIATEPSNSDDW